VTAPTVADVTEATELAEVIHSAIHILDTADTPEHLRGVVAALRELLAVTAVDLVFQGAREVYHRGWPVGLDSSVITPTGGQRPGWGEALTLARRIVAATVCPMGEA
jgi:hypothetical protein